MFVIVYVMGIYLADGEVLIRSHKFLPHFEKPTLTFNSREKCEAYLLKDAKERSDSYGEKQKIFFEYNELVVARQDRLWFSSSKCLEIEK